LEESDIRRHRRYAVQFGVELSASSWDDVLQLTTINVSRGGLFLRSEQMAQLGSRVRLAVRLPDDSRLEVEGEVVHLVKPDPSGSRPAGFGVRFDEQHALELNMLEATAASHAKGRNTYQLERRHLVLPAIVRNLQSGASESTQAVQMSNQGDRARQQQRVKAEQRAKAEPVGRSRALANSAPAELGEVEVSLETGDYEVVDSQKNARPAIDENQIFGVDFGTTYSSIGLVTGDGIQVLEDADGNAMIPSVVCYTGRGQPIVGWQAREMVSMYRASTFMSPKRLLGRRFDDPKVQPYLAATPVETVRGQDGGILAKLGQDVVAIAQVCAEIFRKLMEIARDATGVTPRNVVVSAPVGYSKGERKAIERAATLAGLKVIGLIEEPVAAAMAYGLGRAEGERIAIYDFGGGTFDCTLLEIRNERFKMLASAGDPWLGGDDFDLAMANHTADQFWRMHNIDLRTRAVEWQRLVLLCERVKRKLTTELVVELRARNLVQTAKGSLDLQLRFDRAVFAELCGELVERSVEEMDRCLAEANVQPETLHHVVLTGGVSRIPLVRQHLQRYYQREIQLAVNPEQAIVMGNSIYARFIQLTRK
jgi:actin-like ATPase involved in cell morphogenesis/Tfp pilus assembly protein PilZ